ncbi:MAG TPA: hypothetical protein VD966_10995, partial [Pyrinomonadaceae bacterium]|nr:hypothetical protein [Pyrinomonadaceae bacterium]
MSGAGRIVRIDPRAGITGGEVVIECENFDTSRLRACSSWFDGARGHLVGASSRRVLAVVPETAASGEVEVRLESGGQSTSPTRFVTGRKLAEDLHPVANPAFDPDDGALFVTRSGSRGQQFPVSIFRIDAGGEITEFSGEVTNPTSIAFDKSGHMYVSSRMDGTVYRITPFKDV